MRIDDDLQFAHLKDQVEAMKEGDCLAGSTLIEDYTVRAYAAADAPDDGEAVLSYVLYDGEGDAEFSAENVDALVEAMADLHVEWSACE